MISVLHLLLFPSFYFPVRIPEASVAPCLLSSVGHGTQVKPNPQSINIQKMPVWPTQMLTFCKVRLLFFS